LIPGEAAAKLKTMDVGETFTPRASTADTIKRVR